MCDFTVISAALSSFIEMKLLNTILQCIDTSKNHTYNNTATRKLHYMCNAYKKLKIGKQHRQQNCIYSIYIYMYIYALCML